MAFIHCPEAKIELPIDLWYCKLKDQACPIQGIINTDSWVTFNEHCLAPNDRREGIQESISSGRYTGFHHIPGRYLCPMCKPSRKGNWERAYHYPENLQHLQLFVPYDEETLRTKIIKKNIPSVAQFGRLCRKCLNDILYRLGLPSVDEQENQYHGYGEPLNEFKSISFKAYLSIRERIGGGELCEDTCSWCGNGFYWNEQGESLRYDIYLESKDHSSKSFVLCQQCGNKFRELFHI